VNIGLKEKRREVTIEAMEEDKILIYIYLNLQKFGNNRQNCLLFFKMERRT